LFEGNREKGTVFVEEKDSENQSVSTQVTAESADLNKKIEEQKNLGINAAPVKGLGPTN